MAYWILLFWICVVVCTDDAENKFDYEFKVLKKLTELEIAQHYMETTIENLQKTIFELKMELKDQEEFIGEVNATFGNRTPSSTYVRWGRTTCPVGATFLYKGQAATSHYATVGGGSNYLCLPENPIFKAYNKQREDIGTIYGVEYETGPNDDKKMPCVLCLAYSSSTLMIPARDVCPQGLNLEYAGKLASGCSGQSLTTDYICIDNEEEVFNPDSPPVNGGTANYVESRCGTLQCPPYIDGAELTCAVCSYPAIRSDCPKQ